jgi:hypothetical protein
MNPRQQGDRGELAAAYWLANKGAYIYMPFGHSPHVDVVASWNGGFVGVQVKTSNSLRHGRWVIGLCTRGGNQSWTGITKLFDPYRCDYLFVLVGDGRQWFIPSNVVDGTTAICLGGSKYAEFEVEPGLPLAPDQERKPALQSSLA